jgi:hypothetical protein
MASSLEQTFSPANRSASSSFPSDVLRRFLVHEMSKELSADGGGDGSHPIWCDFWRFRAPHFWSGAVIEFRGLTSVSALLSSVLSLPVSDVCPSNFSCAFNSAARCSLTSGGRMAHSPLVGSAMIHSSSAYLFCDHRVELSFKFGNKLGIVGLLEHRCARPGNKVGTLSSNDVEAVLEIHSIINQRSGLYSIPRLLCLRDTMSQTSRITESTPIYITQLGCYHEQIRRTFPIILKHPAPSSVASLSVDDRVAMVPRPGAEELRRCLDVVQNFLSPTNVSPCARRDRQLRKSGY